MLKSVVCNESEQEWESWDDPQLRSESPVRWKLLVSAGRTCTSSLVMGVAEIAPSGSLIRHSHKEAETYYVLRGHGVISIDGEQNSLAPGSAVYIPPDSKHFATCIGDEPLAFIFSFPCDRWEEVEYVFDE